MELQLPELRGGARATLRAQPRTQSSIAVAGFDDLAWALVNASPDILEQLKAQASFSRVGRCATAH